MIKSIQRLSDSLADSSTRTVSINEVDPNKTMLKISGFGDSASGGGRYYAELVDSTSVFISNAHTANTWDYRIEVVEFN